MKRQPNKTPSSLPLLPKEKETPEIFDNHIRWTPWLEISVSKSLPIPRLNSKRPTRNSKEEQLEYERQTKVLDETLSDILDIENDAELNHYHERKRELNFNIAGYLEWKDTWTKGFYKEVDEQCRKVAALCEQLHECLNKVQIDDGFMRLLQDSMNDLVKDVSSRRSIFDYLEEKELNLSSLENLFINVKEKIHDKKVNQGKNRDGEKDAFLALIYELIHFFEQVSCHKNHNRSVKETDEDRIFFVGTVLFAYGIGPKTTQKIYQCYKNGMVLPLSENNKLIRDIKSQYKQYQTNLKNSLNKK